MTANQSVPLSPPLSPSSSFSSSTESITVCREVCLQGKERRLASSQATLQFSCEQQRALVLLLWQTRRPGDTTSLPAQWLASQLARLPAPHSISCAHALSPKKAAFILSLLLYILLPVFKALLKKAVIR